MKVIVTEQGRERIEEIKTLPVTVGRASSNTIVTLDPKASRWHCRVDKEGDDYVLVDLDSSNGTMFGAEKVKRQPLKSGDVFRVGEVSFRVVYEAPAAKATPSPAPSPVAPAPPARASGIDTGGGLAVLKGFMVIVCVGLALLSAYFALQIYFMMKAPGK
ncbi:MAG: FHA domain-containing protein [Planctomycetota bacterium]